MTVVYRAIWHDDRKNCIDASIDKMNEWLEYKTDGSLALSEDITTSSNIIKRNSITGETETFKAEACLEISKENPEQGRFAKAVFTEYHSDKSRWETTLRSWNTPEEKDGGWVWIDVDAVGLPGLKSIAVGAPRFVRELLDDAERANLNGTMLSVSPIEIRGQESGQRLSKEILREERTLPLVVFSTDTWNLPEDQKERQPASIKKAARQIAGIAQVFICDHYACNAITESLGKAHGVWNSALRVYLPKVRIGEEGDYWRHRYVTADNYLAYGDRAAAQKLARLLGPDSGLKRPPASYQTIKKLLQKGDEEWVRYLEGRVEQLESDRNDLEERYLYAINELETSQADRDKLSGALRNATKQVLEQSAILGRNNLLDDSWGSSHSEMPDSAENLTQAVAFARQYLTLLHIPENVEKDLDILDAEIEGRVWGNKCWQAFRALQAYAEDKVDQNFPGSFYEWCAQGGTRPDTWPANSKHLAMRESETTMGKYASTRVFPISTKVDPSGKVTMEAHIKIAEGGGNLAPRIYFYWHSEDCTVHIGFIGPHKYVPNSKA